jgi:BMFP domain-containing protein YqiC
LNLALLATERLAILYERCGQHDGAMRQVRDKGLLLCHLKQFSNAQEALQLYEEWISQSCPADLESTIQSMQKAKQGGPLTVSKEEADIVSQVLLKAQREALEKQIQ